MKILYNKSESFFCIKNNFSEKRYFVNKNNTIDNNIHLMKIIFIYFLFFE